MNISKEVNIKIFLTIFFLGIIYWFLFDFLRWIEFDSPSYVGAARYLFGLEGGFDVQSRLPKPLVLILPGFIEMISGLHPKYIFLLQNFVCFFLSGFLMYKILFVIFKDSKIAFSGMLAYITCQCFAIYSLFILTDVVGWFFGLLGIFLILDKLQDTKLNLYWCFFIGAVSGIGITAKESAIIVMIFLSFFILFKPIKFKNKIIPLLIALIGFSIPAISNYLIIDGFYGSSLISRVQEQQQAKGMEY